jgi:predicted PurR-regulated permease PerM
MPIKKKAIIYFAVIALTLLIIFFVYRFRKEISTILEPFFMALIIAYLINPLILKLESKKIKRGIGIFIIYFVFALILGSIVVFIIPRVANNTKDLMNTLPDITKRYQNMFNDFMSLIKSSNWPPEVKDSIFREVQNSAAVTQNFIMDYLRKSLLILIDTITMFLNFVLALVIAYYFIIDAEFFKAAALSFTPRRWRNGIINTGREVHLILSGFIQGQLITALIIGIMETIGLSLIGVKYSLVLGLIGGIANIIPYFGPIIGAIPAVAIALIDSPVKVLWTILVFIIIQQIDNSFISPKIIEGKLGLHPVTTILAVLVGGEFFGIFGMLVSVPITAIAKVIIGRSIEAIVK